MNGGPGTSSMIGLFRENGPCNIKLDTTGFEANPHSWHENANIIYVDPEKNITTLVKAFGECRPLRELANLVRLMLVVHIFFFVTGP